MANLVITSNPTIIKIDFGTYATYTGYDVVYFQRQSIISSKNNTIGGYVNFDLLTEGFNLSIAGTNSSYIVDTIDGVAPVSNADLNQKLSVLISGVMGLTQGQTMAIL